ncbi:hypothetical protein [Phytopseudomonas punonensis]|uniref:Uncharacterized protein n=1 Tax=Phytopseudomonas punonensis TaxID=1220495 RepID=A0A1M7FBC4_9GAMM|nr:hypothetical protein [Pseudomonas punonensis]SHM01374.1 hypothetical protein SAMN05216288_2826 [Pseudomonas punonensis]
MKHSLKQLAIALAVILAALGALFVAIAYWAVPTAQVRNESAEAVQVVAQWRDQSRDLGSIRPEQTVAFKVPGEGGIRFHVTYANGRQVTSREMYYTLTTTVLAVVSEQAVSVDSELGLASADQDPREAPSQKW